MRLIPPGVLSLGAALALLLGACSSGDADAVADGIATLEGSEASAVGDGAEASTLDGDAGAEELSAEEIALAFSACMRDEGVDFPDIGVDAEGRIELRAGFEDIETGTDAFRSANETCQPLLADTGFGAGNRAAIGEDVEIQDALVEFADCMRSEGLDVGDITLGGQNGGGAPGDADGSAAGGEPPADGQGRGQGQRQQGFGDPSERLAEQLGLDLEAPEVAAAIDICSPIIEAAFAEQGVGQP